jgi:hypothetical protein
MIGTIIGRRSRIWTPPAASILIIPCTATACLRRSAFLPAMYGFIAVVPR